MAGLAPPLLLGSCETYSDLTPHLLGPLETYAWVTAHWFEGTKKRFFVTAYLLGSDRLCHSGMIV